MSGLVNLWTIKSNFTETKDIKNLKNLYTAELNLLNSGLNPIP